MAYTLSINELLERPIIRSDKMHEMLNKMTDDEIVQYENEIHDIIKNEPVKDWVESGVSFLNHSINRMILYDCLKLGKNGNE